MTIPLTKTLLGACALAIFVAPAVAAQDLSAEPMQGDAMPGKLWVQFTDEVPSAGFAQTGFEMFDRIAARFDVESVDKAFPFLDGFAAKRTLSESGEALRRTYEVSYSAPFNPLVVAAALAADPNVVYAEPRYYDYVFKEPGISPDPLERPNDPQWSSQDDYLDRVEIEAAWDEVKGSDSTFVVAIVDTGTDWEHEDLSANIWENEDEIPDNDIDDDDNGFVDDIRGWNFSNDSNDPSSDGNSHGTQTAGTAAATTNNETGIAGTSWNAQLMPINATCANNAALLCHTVDGVLYAAMNGASVINASYGSSSPSITARKAMQTALDEGALVVAASGNGGTDSDRQPFYPAGYNQTLSVGGTQRNLDINQYNYGRSVNVYLAALGISVTSPSNQYGTASGTSFSAPLASGIAALVKTKFPEWGPERVREQMRLTADEIDSSNPSSLNGKFGRGRVNALRAVTEDPLPGVRVAEWSWIDDDGNGALIKGETATVTIKFKNYHGDAEGLEVGIETESAHDSWVDITTASVDVGSLANGDSTTATLVFDLTDSAPNNSTLLLYTRITADGEFTDSPDIMRISFNNTDTATHNTGDLQVSITSQGNIGYLDFQNDNTGGVGFKPIDANGQVRDILFEGGLIVASSASDVSDCLRGGSTNSADPQNDEFGLKEDTFIELLTDGVLTTQRGRLTLVETASTGTVGVEILQESYVDEDTLYSDGIILAYTLTNVTESTLEDVHVGLFFDWDINSDANDDMRWDEEREVGYVLPDATGSEIVVGTKVLSDEGDISYRAIDNPNEIYRNLTGGGFDDDEKYEWISDGVNVTEHNDIDVSQITGVGPFTIESGADVVVAFAVVAGTSVEDFQSNVDNMQDLWDNVIDTSVEGGETPVAASFALRGVYPNPMSSKATLSYELETRGEVTLAVYDVLGRRVRTVWSGQRNVGRYETEWDGLDDAGARVAAGVYMVTMTATDGKQRVRTTRPLVLVK